MTEEKEHDLVIPLSIKVVFIILTVLFFAILFAFSWVVRDVRDNTNDTRVLVAQNEILNKENKNRIKEIQASRIESCKQSYLGIRRVFKPFFPPPPRTKKQKADLDKFNTTIFELRKGCSKQVNPEEK